MMPTMYRGILVLFLWFGVLMQTAFCVEINDKKFGFRCTIPDDFLAMDQDSNLQECLYRYFDGEPSPGDIPQLIQIQRMHRTIDPRERLQKDKLPSLPRTKITLEETQWHQLTLDIIRTEAGLSAKDTYVGYAVQFPLAEEAIQLQVSGPLEKDAEVRRVFKAVVTSFQPLKPLPKSSEPSPPTPNPPISPPAANGKIQPLAAVQKRPTEAQATKSQPGTVWIVLGAFALVVLALGVILMRKNRHPKV